MVSGKGRKPTHSIKIYDPEWEQDKGRYVGVGWEGKDGSIQLKIDVGIAISTANARVVIFRRKDEDDDDGGERRWRRRDRDEDHPGRRYDD